MRLGRSFLAFVQFKARARPRIPNKLYLENTVLDGVLSLLENSVWNGVSCLQRLAYTLTIKRFCRGAASKPLFASQRACLQRPYGRELYPPQRPENTGFKNTVQDGVLSLLEIRVLDGVLARGLEKNSSQRRLEGVRGRHGQLAGQVLADVRGGLTVHFAPILEHG